MKHVNPANLPFFPVPSFIPYPGPIEQTLLEAYEVIKHNWCSRHVFVEIDSQYQFCAVGAVRWFTSPFQEPIKALGHQESRICEKTIYLLCRVSQKLYSTGIIDVNDRLGKAATLLCFKEAIKIAHKERL